MLVLILCFSIAAAILSLLTAIRISGSRATIGSEVATALAPNLANVNSKLDTVQQSGSIALASALESSSRGIVSEIAQVKEETRARIDEQLNSQRTELRRDSDTFRESMEKQISAARTETQNSIASLSTVLDQRSNTLQTQVTTVLNELERAVREGLAQSRAEARDSLNGATALLLQAFQDLQASNERKLNDIRQSLEQKLAENIKENLGAFNEMTSGIAELKLTSDRIMQVSQEIGELTDILKSPKLRGDFGEFELENMLRDLIPPDHYEVKSKVNGSLADAAILLPEGKLCIDSKFPYENYKRATAPETPDDDRESFARLS